MSNEDTIQQDILYLSTPDGKRQLSLNCSCQTIAAYTRDGRMIAEKQVSPNETSVLHVFFTRYPDLVLDDELQHALLCGKDRENAQRKVFRVVAQLRRRKLAPIGLRLLRVNQIGYVLEVIPVTGCMTTRSHSVSPL